MKKIFIDLEMTPVPRLALASGRALNGEVIEIGAVALDEQDREIGRFDAYVRPARVASLPENIVQLTGIRTDQVLQAAPFETVFSAFLSWCGSDCTFYAWSESDRRQLQCECEAKGLAGAADRFSWQDFQKIFSRQFDFERRMSLERAVTLAGLDFEGRAHGALTDAANTATLYLQTKKSSFRKLVNTVRGDHARMSVSLGSLFDFAALAV